MFLDQLLFELSCKNTETHTHTHTHTHKHTHTERDSDKEYFIVAFCKNATIINYKLLGKFQELMRNQAKTVELEKGFQKKTNSCVYK